MPRLSSPALLLAAALAVGTLHAHEADTQHLAPGFKSRTAGSRLVIAPADIELFSISAGGITEPRADWTEAAQKNFKATLEERRAHLGAETRMLEEAVIDEVAELDALQRAVAAAVFIHHSGNGLKLPTKNERLEWSMGEAVQPLRARTGADYALFTWIRDSYASNERKLAIVAMALLGSINFGGEQWGYASLVDLNSGRIVWFNSLKRMTGDLRDQGAANETVDALLKGFPQVALP